LLNRTFEPTNSFSAQVFNHITKNPTQPSLHEDDLKELFKQCSDGNVEVFIDSLFPPKPTPHELIDANKKYGNTESVYKNRVDKCDAGNIDYKTAPFDEEGEGERRIYAPNEAEVPNR
jgi:hypothetical protein